MDILYIEGHRVDLGVSKITRNLRVSDIASLELKSSYSYTVKLPITSRNNSIFKMLGTIGNVSDSPYRILSCNYIIDGMCIVNNGRVLIRSKGTHYEVNIIDGIVSMVDALGEKGLQDLDMSDLDYTFNLTNVVASLTNTEGVIYAYARFKEDEVVSTNVNVKYLYPSIYVHTIVSRIFSESNIVVSGDFFSTNEKYLIDVLPTCKGFLQTEGQTVNVSNILPDTTQIEFIKDVCYKYGLVIFHQNNEYKFIQIENLFNDVGGAEDWTNKVQSVGIEKYKPELSRYNLFRNKNWDTYYRRIRPIGERQYSEAEYYIKIDNDNLEYESEFKTLLYEVFNAPILNTDISTNVYECLILNSADELQDINQINASLKNEINDITFILGASSQALSGYPVLQRTFVSAVSLVTNNYARYEEVMSNYLEIDMVLNLSTIDIYNIRFDRLKYFKQFGRYFYLNEIQYSAGNLAKCKLIRI